jgi:electron transport complex protein RnfC
MQLYPGKVEKEINYGRNENLKELNINCCIECGCCSFVCPAKRPLAKSMRIAKEILRRENNNG